MEWRKIETAPKDEIILLSDGRDVVVGWWTDDKKYPWSFVEDTEFVDELEEWDKRKLIQPNAYPNETVTHWMPLPKPPTSN